LKKKKRGRNRRMKEAEWNNSRTREGDITKDEGK
jgi:hypothetical protein